MPQEQPKKMTFTASDIPVVLSVLFSATMYSFGMNYFVKTGNLFPGGYGGISRLVSQFCLQFLHINISFSVIYFALNIITVILLWRHIGHKFMIYSCLFFTTTSILTAIIPVRSVTNDILLIAVFGGVISGFSTGIVLRNNASSGGTDFIAIYMSTRFNIPTWNYIMAGNAMILILAGILFGWEQALYSIIYQYVSTQIVNVLHQRYRYTKVDIITNFPEEVCDAIFRSCRHGVTMMPCEGGFSHKQHWNLVITVNTYQLQTVLNAVRASDPSAFITTSSVDRIIGNFYQTPLE